MKIISPRSALMVSAQVKDIENEININNIKEKFLNTAFLKNDLDNESEVSIL